MVRALGRARLPRSGPRTGGGAGPSAAAAAGRAVPPGSRQSYDAGRGGPGDAGPGAAAPPRRRDHVGAGARSSRGAIPRGQVLRGGRHRPAGTARAGPLCRAIPPARPPPRRARALQDPRPEPRGTPGSEGPREGPREHRPSAAAGRASCRGPAERVPCQGACPPGP